MRVFAYVVCSSCFSTGTFSILSKFFRTSLMARASLSDVAVSVLNASEMCAPMASSIPVPDLTKLQVLVHSRRRVRETGGFKGLGIIAAPSAAYSSCCVLLL